MKRSNGNQAKDKTIPHLMECSLEQKLSHNLHYVVRFLQMFAVLTALSRPHKSSWLPIGTAGR
jgi:hypothetical protein